MNIDFNLLLNKVENGIRKSRNYSLSKDECKKLVHFIVSNINIKFREEKINEKEVDRVIAVLDTDKNVKIKYNKNEKAFVFISKFGFTDREGVILIFSS
jgi:hypothetical protein